MGSAYGLRIPDVARGCFPSCRPIYLVSRSVTADDDCFSEFLDACRIHPLLVECPILRIEYKRILKIHIVKENIVLLLNSIS